MNWFYNLKVAKKLIMAFLVLSAITAVVGYFGIDSMSRINDMADKIYQQELLAISYVKEANINLIYLDRASKNLLLSATKEERELYTGRIAEFERMYKENLDKSRPLLYTEQAKQMLARLDKEWTDFRAVLGKIVEMAKADALQEKRTSVEMALGVGREKINAVDDTLTELTKVKEQNAKSASEETTRIISVRLSHER